MNWLVHEDIILMQTLSDEENEKSRPSAGLFEVLCEKFKLQHNETILSL